MAGNLPRLHGRLRSPRRLPACAVRRTATSRPAAQGGDPAPSPPRFIVSTPMQIRNVPRSDLTPIRSGDNVSTPAPNSVPPRRARSASDLQAMGLCARGTPSSAPLALPAIGIATHHEAVQETHLSAAAALETELLLPHATDAGLAPRIASRLMNVATRIAEHCAVKPSPGEPQAPIPEAWRCLEALASLRLRLHPAQLGLARQMLLGAVEASTHAPLDKALLQDILKAVTQADGPGLDEYVARRAYDGLCLGQLQLKADDEAEPPPGPSTASCRASRPARMTTTRWGARCCGKARAGCSMAPARSGDARRSRLPCFPCRTFPRRASSRSTT